MTRKFDSDYQVASTTEILTSENTFRKDVDIRIDNLENGQGVIDVAAAEARDRVVKYTEDVLAPKAAELQSLLTEFEANRDAIRDDAVFVVRGGVETRGDTLAKILVAIDGVSATASTVVAALALLAPLASPAFGGIPSAPTAAPGTSTTQIANTAFVAAAITALIGAAPGALDTLKELADALGDDANFAATVTTALATKATTALVSTKEPVRNRHLNPAFRICQDRVTGSVLSVSASQYAFDGVAVIAGGGGVLACSQVLSLTPGGSPYRLRASVSTADAAMSGSDSYGVEFPIEGTNVSDFMFGTAAARPFTWRGVVKMPAGTYGLSFRNNDVSRSYVTTFTISAGQANVDTLITAVVPGDTAGTWVKDASGIGITARIAFAMAPSFQTTTTGSWQGGNYATTSAQTNGMSSTSNVFEVADIGFYPGTELPAWVLPNYPWDAYECMRLYEPSYSVANGTGYCVVPYSVPKRVPPSVSIFGQSQAISTGPTAYTNNFVITFAGTTGFSSVSSCRL